MKLSTLISLLVGAAVLVGLLLANDLPDVLRLVRDAGAGILGVVALHLPQVALSAFGWTALLPGDERRALGAPRLAPFRLRWVRESANALLPVAQVGGDFIRARLAVQRGLQPRSAAAAGAVDLSVEMLSQIAFTLVGLGLLAGRTGGGDSLAALAGAGAVGALIAVSFAVAQRRGLFRWVERKLTDSEGARQRFAFLGDMRGLNDAVIALWRDRRAVGASAALHFGSWLLGVVETYAALRVLGFEVTLAEAAIVESLGQAVRGLGFFVPGALGVQEGGYVLVCGLIGVPPQGALALALVRRVRELALGLPGLLLWRRLERHRPQRLTPAEGAA